MDAVAERRNHSFRYYKSKFNGWNESDSWSLNAVTGIYDDPENQAQLPLSVDFANGGHLAVCGSVVTGKSTFLQTLIYSLAVKYSRML